jgi:hypothetical protein
MQQEVYPAEAGTVQLENTRRYMRQVHSEDLCAGRPCTIHNRTDHPMRSFPQAWRYDKLYMERVCPHHIGHPDPDEYKLLINPDLKKHVCDGCCEGEN